METSEQINSQPQIPLLTYNSLFNILREERRIKAIQNLPQLFYEAISKYLIDKKEEIKKLKTQDDSLKLKKEKNILKNSEKLINEILNLRCMKIANIAIKNELFGEDTLSAENLLESEQEYAEKIKKSTKSIKQTIK